jgi:hypothetical protein
MTLDRTVARRLIWVAVFGVAFALVEAGVVVYLRALYYPDGFSFPLKFVSGQHLALEVSREIATIIMLVSVGAIAGSMRWEKFAFFLFTFGVWDIFYYGWLKVAANWPASLTDPDILFLIPLPWIGPVIAPLLLALLMSVCGAVAVVRISRNGHFRPLLLSWLLSAGATAAVMYSFMADIPAALYGQMPLPYRYELLIGALLLYSAAFVIACRPPAQKRSGP